MTRVLRLACGTVLFALLVAAPALAINTADTRLLSQPAISRSNIAFIYAGDVWVAGLDGKDVRRLTSGQGASNPAFSPDGTLVAFTAQYDGNADVYVVPVTGGVPTRLTWHPARDTVQGFTPDGTAVVFTSPRAVFSNRYTQLFTVPVKGGFPTQVELPYAFRGAFSPDGRRIAYNPLSDAFLEWKHYRGGTHSTICLYTLATRAIETVPQPPDRPNDVYPMWIGEVVYFVSDRNGEFNLFSYDTRSKLVRQLTDHADFPVLWASAGGGKVIYEQAGYLHVFDPATGKHAKLTVAVTADLPDTRPRFVKGARYVRAAAVSPSGARAVFEFRGEIVTLPAEKGDPRNLTNTPGVHERAPAWSPDGRSIAYVSDGGGEYHLVVQPQDGKGEAKSYKLAGAGFYGRIAWSPDSRKIAYTDNAWSLFWIDLASGASKKVASEAVYGPVQTIGPAWAPDSKWIAYTLSSRTYIRQVHVYSLDQDKSYPVTDGLSDVSEPSFDASGKYLYFFGSTDSGPVQDWFAMSNADTQATSALYLAVLRRDLPSPLAKESDEEKKKEDTPADKPAAAPPVPTVSIDFEGLSNRILAVALPSGGLGQLEVGEAGQIFFTRAADGKAALHHYDLSTRKDETLLGEVDRYVVSADGKKILYRTGTTVAIGPSKGTIDPGQGHLNVDAIEVRIDPRVEWPQIFDEAWRINRDFFYDPTMHGVDWAAMRTKYAAFLPDLAVRGDLNRVIQWMCSELGVGHHRVGLGDVRTEPASVPGGLLGADYAVENGRYRIKKVYGGLNWNPDLRSPLTEPGVDVKAGEYLLAVDAKDLRPPANLYAAFENTAGRLVEITVGPSPDGSGSRTVSVVPVTSEAALRNRDWVEGNLRRVTEATKGRVAYVYVPDTSTLGHAYFKRYFYPQANRDAIIVDERFNGGGSVADYYLDLLRRPLGAYWATRYGADIRTPTASIQGPKVLLIDETAGSGGDLFPWMWRKFNMGPIVGKRTWGGLVGILGFPVLMDGGSVTAPNLAIWTEEGWVVENIGVPPDIEVDQTPADVIAGKDPQLERAIQVALDELKKHPTARPTRPAWRNVPQEREKK
jgi:tricorn protease